jgi:hypothetical protein
MPNRSQRHLQEREGGGGGSPPAITNISPDTLTTPNNGTSERLIATMVMVGGTAPVTAWTIIDAAGCYLQPMLSGGALRVEGSLIADAPGVYNVQIRVTDSAAQTKTETLVLTTT